MDLFMFLLVMCTYAILRVKQQRDVDEDLPKVNCFCFT